MGCDGIWKGSRASEEQARAKQLAQKGILVDVPMPKDKVGRSLMKFVAESISILDQSVADSDQSTITASTIQNLLTHLVSERGHFGQGKEIHLGKRENEEWSKFLRNQQTN